MALPTSLPTANMVTPRPSVPDIFLKEVREIGEEVQMVTSEISEKFVPLPKRDNSLGDLLVGLKRFRNVVRWKEFFLNQQKENEEKTSESENDLLSNAEVIQEEKEFPRSLGTNLKPTICKQAPIGSNNLESFLSEVESTLINQVYDYYEVKKRNISKRKTTGNAISSNIERILKDLMNSRAVIIPTDKTNNFVAVEFDKYLYWMKNHIDKCGFETPRSKLVEIFDESEKLLEEMKVWISKNEYNFVREKLLTRGIPTPMLLIKDHKRKHAEGVFPTRIIVPQLISRQALQN